MSNSKKKDVRPFVSVIIPAYNEEVLLKANVSEIYGYISALKHQYRWEVLIVDDGSSDQTGAIADEIARGNEDIRVLHHPRNFGLGQALKFGFANTNGDYVITMDVDLSYDVEHIAELLEAIRKTHSKIVLASPFMEGGTIRNVPLVRKTLSILGNRFLRISIVRIGKGSRPSYFIP